MGMKRLRTQGQIGDERDQNLGISGFWSTVVLYREAVTNGRPNRNDEEEPPPLGSERDNPMIQQILERMSVAATNSDAPTAKSDTSNEGGQFSEKSGRRRRVRKGLGEFHPFSMEIAETPFPRDF
ncbi:AraC family transcriptional regulator [Sesbania bispinosa]|nr:AraC family transcriptional regulator [Sesbania bispinosa]